jgi:hypothetical protein
MPSLGIKIMKENPNNPSNQGLSCSTKSLPQFTLKHNFDLLEFSFRKLFYIQ